MKSTLTISRQEAKLSLG